MNDQKTAINPRRDQDYPAWYQEVVREADLAENSDVRGCMVIKPWGYGIWENIQRGLDRKFKATGHKNAYFPLFIPLSYLAKEAEHVEGFAKECAVVTHHRLEAAPGGGLRPAPSAQLAEPLVVRPTSETIIGASFAKWVKSYRDLPILINQWCNVVRWEMRTRIFLRTAEFLWQEGHTAHETEQEAVEETERMLGVYADFVENWMAVPVIQGVKTPGERFAGAVETYCIEALMQDGKALQCGTSHFLGQNFAKAFEVKFLNKENQQEYVWATSWGVSTRLIGALVMAHSDDQGLVLPPKIAPFQVVIVPIYKGEESKPVIDAKANEIIKELKAAGIRVKYDNNDNNRPGWKFAEYELKGVPVRLAMGLRDMENNVVELARRDTKEKQQVPISGLSEHITKLLDEIQQNLYNNALKYREQHITSVDSWDEFVKTLNEKGGFVAAHWNGTAETEAEIKEKTKATIRCIPFNNPPEMGVCIFSGKPSKERVLFAI